MQLWGFWGFRGSVAGRGLCKLRCPNPLKTPSIEKVKVVQGALKGTNLRGQTEPKRRFSQIFADFCRFSPFPRKQSIWETQIFAENRGFLTSFEAKFSLENSFPFPLKWPVFP